MNAAIRIIAWILAVALVALPVVAVLQGWIAGERWPMRRLVVHGEFQRVGAEQIRSAVLPHAGRGFFAVDLDAVRGAVAALPWVERVEVRKRWPDRIEIAVSEHRPFARWAEDRLLSEHGRLFAAPGGTGLPEGLPALAGPDARLADVVALYNRALPLFAGTGRRVDGVSLSARGSWTLTLDGGAEIIVGRDDAQPRIRRFARLLPQIVAAERRPLLRADLRYTNGFALTWQEPAPTQQPPPPLAGGEEARLQAIGLRTSERLSAMREGRGSWDGGESKPKCWMANVAPLRGAPPPQPSPASGGGRCSGVRTNT